MYYMHLNIKLYSANRHTILKNQILFNYSCLIGQLDKKSSKHSILGNWARFQSVNLIRVALSPSLSSLNSHFSFHKKSFVVMVKLPDIARSQIRTSLGRLTSKILNKLQIK